MLTTTNKTNYSYVRKLLVLPLLCASLFLFSFSFKNNTTVNKAKKEIVMVLDAGHGGTDAGVTGINGTPEKDLTLRITNKMSELASAYNIKVVLTRNGDEYPTLDQRVQMVKATAADLLVSIHVNDRQEKGTGYEVIVGRGSTKKAESVELASAISSKLQEIHIQSRLVEKGVHVLKTADVPAVLIECGYINDVKEMAMVDNDAELEKLCRNILSGVVNFESNKR